MLSLAIFGAQAAYAQQVVADGTAQPASGTINTGTQAPPDGYALHALNNGSITSSAALALITGGAGACGAVADSGGQIDIALGSTVTTAGSAALGLWADRTGTGSTISTITATGTAITTTADYAHGMVAGGGGEIYLTSGFSVTTSGEDAVGAWAVENGTIALTDGSVKTGGAFAFGLHADDTGATLNVSNTAVRTSGTGATGALVLDGGQIALNNISITTTGNTAEGALADQAGSQLTISGGAITTSGTSASGLRSTEESLLIADGVNILTEGENSDGATAQLGAELRLTNSIVETIGGSSIGLLSAGAQGGSDASLMADGVTVTTSGADSHGAAVRGGGGLVIQNGSDVTAMGTGAAGLHSSVYDANPNATAIITSSTLISEQGAGILTDGATLNATLTGSSLTGDAALLQTLNGGTLDLTADASTLTGAALTEAPSSASNVTLQNGTLWTMTGDSNVTTLTHNASTIRFASVPPVVGTTLTVGENYTGNGGTLEIRTELGDDSCATDKLVVTGDTLAGTTYLRVSNQGGAGALTTGDGILVVQVDGASSGTFALANTVRAANYVYTLAQVGTHWYLQSTYSPAPATTAIPVTGAAGLALLGGLVATAGAYMRRRRSAK